MGACLRKKKGPAHKAAVVAKAGPLGKVSPSIKSKPKPAPKPEPKPSPKVPSPASASTPPTPASVAPSKAKTTTGASSNKPTTGASTTKPTTFKTPPLPEPAPLSKAKTKATPTANDRYANVSAINRAVKEEKKEQDRILEYDTLQASDFKKCILEYDEEVKKKKK